MSALKRIGVVAHPLRPQSIPVAERIAANLREHDLNPWLLTTRDQGDIAANVASTDLVIAIGGDGAMLRAVRATAPHGVPVLGVNMGHLGFLAEVEIPDCWDSALAALLDNAYWIEERMMVRVTVYRGDEVIATEDALNDIVVTRGRAVGTVLLQTYIDLDWATTYHADALVIATATGSTAYALAVGGPILPPNLRNILVVPVAPHLSMDRPLVLSEGATVDVVISSERPADSLVIVDGIQLCETRGEDRIHVTLSQHTGRFVRLRDRNYFYRSLLDRLEPRLPMRSAPERLHLKGDTDA